MASNALTALTALQKAMELNELCKELRQDKDAGRLWAIANTDAEKLMAWIAYILGANVENN